MPQLGAERDAQRPCRELRQILCHFHVKSRYCAGCLAHGASNLCRIEESLAGRCLRTEWIDVASKHGGKQLAFKHPPVCEPVSRLTLVVAQRGVVIPTERYPFDPSHRSQRLAGCFVCAAAGGDRAPVQIQIAGQTKPGGIKRPTGWVKQWVAVERELFGDGCLRNGERRDVMNEVELAEDLHVRIHTQVAAQEGA